MKKELKKLQEALTQVQKYQMDEPDHEGEMAKSQMLKTMKYAADIMNMIDDSSNLPAWVQSKLTKIADYIGAVKHYMDSKTVRHVVTNMGEGVERKSEQIRLVDMVPLNAKNKSAVNEVDLNEKKYKITATKSELDTAYKLGVKAFNRGIKRAPALDKKLMNMLKGKEVADTSSIDIMDAWIKGWNAESSKAPVGESVNEATEPQIITQLRDVVKNGYQKLKDPKTGRKVMVDSFSASAMVKVYDGIKNPSVREKYVNTGIFGMQKLAFKFVK